MLLLGQQHSCEGTGQTTPPGSECCHLKGRVCHWPQQVLWPELSSAGTCHHPSPLREGPAVFRSVLPSPGIPEVGSVLPLDLLHIALPVLFHTPSLNPDPVPFTPQGESRTAGGWVSFLSETPTPGPGMTQRRCLVNGGRRAE